MRNRLARKMAAEMRGATCAGTQTSKAPTLSGPSVTNHYSVAQHCSKLLRTTLQQVVDNVDQVVHFCACNNRVNRQRSSCNAVRKMGMHLSVISQL